MIMKSTATRVSVMALLTTFCHGFSHSRTHTFKQSVTIPSIVDIHSRPRSQSILRSANVKKHQRIQPLYATYTVPDESNRPPWALPWMPTSLISLRPITQFLIGLSLYVFHLRILTQHHIAFPFQLIPNEQGWFTSIGLDSIAGMISFGGLVWLRKASLRHTQSKHGANAAVAIPPIWSKPTKEESPWRLQSRAGDVSKDRPDARSK